MKGMYTEFDHFKVRLLNGRLLAREDFDTTNFVHSRDDAATFYTRAQLDWAMMEYMNSYEAIGLTSPPFQVEMYNWESKIVGIFNPERDNIP